jgi:hypothetical protein
MSRGLNVILTLALLVVACAKNGGENFAESFDAWTEEKIGRVERIRHLSRAQIWSKRCERAGRDVLAKRADNEPWQIHCTARVVLTVPPA